MLFTCIHQHFIQQMSSKCRHKTALWLRSQTFGHADLGTIEVGNYGSHLTWGLTLLCVCPRMRRVADYCYDLDIPTRNLHFRIQKHHDSTFIS